MKSAGVAALIRIETLLLELGAIEGLVEKRQGVPYRKSAAFLQCPEDPSGIFADVCIGGEWRPLPVSTAAERRRLVADCA